MPTASIIIRTKNEERRIGEVLKRVFDQRDVEFEVIVVDSGSTDRTLSIVSGFAVTLIEIPPETFRYGRALNRGMARASGRFLVSLSAHAAPFDRHWLRNLLAPFDDPAVCAVTGKALPHPDCNPFDRRGLLRRHGTERLYLHAGSAVTFSNANAAVRAEVWRDASFDEELPYSEDLAWSLSRMREGRRVVYEPTAAVYHSHNDTYRDLYRRFHAEAAARAAIGAGVDRYRVSRVVYDAVAGAVFDMATVVRTRRWRRLGEALSRRVAINAGRYAGSRGMPRWDPAQPFRQVALRVGLMLFDRVNANLQRLAPHVVKLTRKHHEAIHPKHLLRDNKEHYWYDDHVRGARRVLDVGCNQGMHAIHAASLAGEVVGLDQDEQALYVAHFNARWESRRNLTLVVGDAGSAWPFANDAFDCVMAFDVVEHVEDRDRFYAELRRVLVPGGTVLLSAPNADTAYKRLKKSVGMRYYCDPTHVIEYSLDELKDECLRGGFETRAVAPVVYDAPLYGLFDFLGALSLPLYERFERYKRQAVVRRPEDTTGYRLVLRRAQESPIEDRPGQ